MTIDTQQSINWSEIMFESLNLAKIVNFFDHASPVEAAIASFSNFGHQGCWGQLIKMCKVGRASMVNHKNVVEKNF